MAFRLTLTPECKMRPRRVSSSFVPHVERQERRQERRAVYPLAAFVLAGILASGALLERAWGGELLPDGRAKPHAVTARWEASDGPELHGSCDTDAECAALPQCRRDPTCDGGPVNMPRRAVVLVGVGCGPDRVIMVAGEEDEFPERCEAIEAHYLPTLP
jgi:hypothetical protein